jgi:hypothetical protein
MVRPVEDSFRYLPCMTLVIAGVAAPFGLVLCDRRLSNEGTPVDDEYNKVTALFTADAKGVFAFTGLARYEDFDTAKAISDALVDHADPEREFLPMRERLVAEVTDRVRRLPLPRQRKLLSIVFAGYMYEGDPLDTDFVKATAVLCRISNFQRGGASYPEAADEFWVDEAAPRAVESTAPYLWAIAGTTQGLPHDQIHKLERLLHEQRPPRAVASKALDVGLEAAKSPKSGGAIGTSWSSAVVLSPPLDPVWVQYHASTTGISDFGTTLVDASAGDQPVIALSNLTIETKEPHSYGFPGTPRNAPCPCGSGAKYKRCHGQPSAAKGGWFLNRLSQDRQLPLSGSPSRRSVS